MKDLERYVAKTLKGMEPLVAEELKSLGAKEVHEKRRAVHFKGDQKILYKANLHSRYAVSILKPLFWFRAHKESVLYRQIAKFDWFSVLDLDQTFAITASVHSSFYRHSKYVALKAKDAIVDMYREHYGRRPNVDPINPDIKINIHVNEAEFDISLDSSGDGLHKRGYRTQGHQAPLNEVLAAGLIKFSGWEPSQVFVDPMCGSGTLPIEACLMSTNTAPGLLRDHFGFMNWKDYNSETYNTLVKEAKELIKKPAAKIIASDKSPTSLSLAMESAEDLGIADYIDFTQSKLQELELNLDGGVVVMNPPYGERLNKLDVISLYKGIGDALKQNFNGFDAWIFSSNAEAFKNVGLRPSKKIPLMNGSLECKLVKYEMYRGSKKAKYQNQE